MTERQFSFPRLLVNLSCLLLAAVLLAGCGSRDTSWRKGGVPGSKPYTVRGKTYYPLKSAHGFVEEGVASWYGPGFHGKKTASGEFQPVQHQRRAQDPAPGHGSARDQPGEPPFPHPAHQ